MSSKAYCIEWRPMAREDFLAIVRNIAKDNPFRAKSLAEELRDKTKSLKANPLLGKHGRPGLPEWLRELVVHPNYIVFYRAFAESGKVEILRVKHAAQQTPR